MNFLKYFLFFFLFFQFSLNAQSNYEFYGGIALKGNEKSMITYRIVFTESNGKITGFSITDLGGEHETKNAINGTYDNKSKTLKFRENNIIYTKSKFDQSAFCFVNFTGKIKLDNNSNSLEGPFEGLYKNKTKCIDGKLTLIGVNKINKIASKINTKIQKSKKIDTKTKDSFNPIKMLDSLKINKLVTNQNLNVFWEESFIDVDIWDNGQEDGDIISLFHNGKIILNNYQVSSVKKRIRIELLTNNDVIKIVAISEGKIKWNTSKIELSDSNKNFELLAVLNKDESTSITIIKNKS